MYTADGTPIEIVGTTVLDINVQGLKMPTKFNVMKKLTHGLILGLDFMIKHDVHLNFKEGVITFEDDLVFAHFCRRSSKHDTFVRNQVATVIPPLTEAIIKARIDNNYSMGTSIIEPLASLADRKLAMARSIVSPKDTFTVCRVLNPTNSTIYLKKNLPLGRIEKIDQHSLGLVQQKEPILRCKEKDSKLNKAFSADEILSELKIKLDKSQMEPRDFKKIQNFLVKNRDIFATSLADLPGTNVTMHRIETGDAKPLRQKFYRATPASKAELLDRLQKCLKWGSSKKVNHHGLPQCFWLLRKQGSKDSSLIIVESIQ